MAIPLRSLLFAPANHARHVQKALTGEADGAILDLEDAVAVSEKPAARAAVRNLLADRAAPYPRAFVRINGLTTPFAYADLLAVVWPGLDGIVLPKSESATQIATADWLITQLERERDMPPGQIEILPIIETAAGLAQVDQIATASPRIQRLNFGAGDFTLDTRMIWAPGNPGLVWARVRVVVASRAANLAAPIDTVFANLHDADGLAAEAAQAKELGFGGKACIHPNQVATVHAIFTPTSQEVARARQIVAAFAEAEAQGVASLRVGELFVDYPVAARARLVLELADYTSTRT
jgi:citrate lyase subunit beta/citryl-CoA lyase